MKTLTATRFGTYLLALLLAPVTAAHAQAPTSGVIVGDLVDATSGAPIAQALVLLRGGGLQTMTDFEGHFVLRPVPPGTHTLEVRRIGYQPVLREGLVVAVGDSITVALSIKPAPFQLAEITVAPGSFSLLDAGPASRQAMSRAELQASPFGEDLFRAVNRLPGLTSGDYGAHFSIRGGRADETLILLDGLEIYEPFHLKDFDGGALSIVDVDATDGVEILTGGFPAHYGDKRSGVMNITSRTPKQDGTRLTVGASFSNAHALAEGNFANRRGSWLLSGRRGFVDLLLGLINKKETKAPTYHDVFGTIRYQIHRNHNLAFSVLHARDRYRFTILGTTGFNDTIPTQEAANNSYGNSYGWLSLRSLFGQHLSVRTLASVGTVTASREGDEHMTRVPIEIYGVKGNRDFSVVGLKQDFRLQPSDRMILDWGYDLRSLDATFDWVNRVTQNPDDPTPDTTGFYPKITRRAKRVSGRTAGAYVSGRLQLLDQVTLETGIRYDHADYSHDRDWSPRVHAFVRLSDRSSLRGGWGEYRQRQGIADENAFDRLDRYFPSERSRQWTVGFEHRYRGGSFRADLYHKAGSRLRPILRNWKSGLNVFPESAEDRMLVYADSSTSKGLELFHEGDIGSRLRLRASYALSLVEEHVSRIDHVNDRLGPVYALTHPGPQDQRHAVNLDLSYRLSGNWIATGAFTFHSGRPFTDEFGVTVLRRNGTTDLAVRPDSLYGARLPSYLRSDLRFTRRVQTARSEFRFFVEVINLTNHENVLGYDVFRVRDANGALRLQRDPETWFSILPSLGVSWSRRF